MSVLVICSSPVARLETVTVAFGTVLPTASRTVPPMLPVDWAKAKAPQRRKQMANTAGQTRRFLNTNTILPPMISLDYQTRQNVADKFVSNEQRSYNG